MGLADDIINGNRGLAGDIISGNYTKKKKKKKNLDRAKESAINSARESLQLVGGTSEISQNRRQSEFENLLNQKAGEDFGIAPVGTKAKKGIATGVDIAGNILQGGLSAAEGVSDFARYRYADIADFVGANKSANKAREIAKRNDTEDIATSFKHIVQGDLNRSRTDEKINENDFITKNSAIKEDSTILGANVRSIFQGVGNTMGYAIMTRGLGGAAAGLENAGKLGKVAKGAVDLLPIYMSAAGGGQTEAYNEAEQMGIDITDKQARRYGTLSGVIEAGTESMFGGLGAAADTLGVSGALGLGKGALDDKLVNSLSKKFKSTLMKNLVDLGVRGLGEGTEELVSGFFNAAAKKLTYASEKDFKELLNDQNLLESFISGTLSSVITQAPANVRATIQGREASTGITNNENRVIEAEVEERTEGKDLTKKEIERIRDEVREDLQNGYISTDIIERTLGQDYDRSNDMYIQESYNERARKKTSFNTDLSQYKNENQRKIVQKAIDSGILNDSKKTHNFVDLVSKIAADKGMDFEFTNNERIKESSFGVEGKIVNGYVNGNTIGLNIESNNALNKTVGHEITHVLEGSDMYQALQDTLRSYVGEGEWQSRLKSLTETYKNVENADVTKELTADLVGENLFNNEEFVRSLSTKNRNLFEKIYDEIKYLVKIATAGSKEKRDLVKLQKVFQEVYRDSKTTREGTQYQLDEVQKTSDLNEYVADAAVREAQQKEADRQAMIDNFNDYLEENNITNPTQQDIDNSIIDQLGYDNEEFSKQDEQYKEYVKTIKDYLNNKDVKYSLTTDNQGRQLSKQQQEYFKDSKARDKDGNLIELYHGTPNEFTKFNYDKLGTNGTLLGKGFYLTDDINVGEAYANKSDNGKIMKLYADIQKPLKWGEKSISKSQYKDFVEAINEETNGTLFADYSGEYSKKGSNQYNSTLNDILMDYEYGGDDIDLISGLLNSTGMSWEKAYRILKNVTGYDGIIVTKDVYDSGEGNVYIPFLPEQIKNVDNTNPTSNPDIRYSLSVQEANTTQDNEGRKLTDNQLAYFKDSKATDENGNLITVYHTMTDQGVQFNEFNPVGTSYYRFGDQVVNYYTDSKDMSGSYANQNYEMADTKRLNNIDEAQAWLDGTNENMKIRSNENGSYSVLAASNKEMFKFSNEDDLLRNLKNTFASWDTGVMQGDKYRNKYQYEGYVNLQNPYIIEAEGRNWDSVSKSRNAKTDLLQYTMPQEMKDNLIKLAEDSKAEYKRVNDKIDSYDNLLKDLSPEERNIYRFYEHFDEQGKDMLEQALSEYKTENYDTIEKVLYDLYNHQLITRDDWIAFRSQEQITDKSREMMQKVLDATMTSPEGETVPMWYFRYNQNNAWRDATGNRTEDQFFMRHLLDEYKDYIENTMRIQLEGYNGRNYEAIDNLFNIANDKFSENSIIKAFGNESNTNDVVKQVIEMNQNGYNYDGVIIRNTEDYGGYSEDHYPHDLYVTFNSNQFKAADNLNPTNDADIRYQLGTNEIAPTRGWDVRGRDIALESAIAPLQEQVQQLQSTLDEVKNNIAPLEDNLPAISEQEASQLESQFNENDIAPIRDNLTKQESQRLDFLDRLERENMLTEGLAEERNELMAKEENAPEYGEDMTPIESLNDVRDMDEVARDRSANAYQYEHPEVKPYFQEEARVLLAEINEVIPGERFMIEGRDANNPTEWLGYKRQASEDVANLLDGYTLGTKYTKDQLREGLNAIIEDHGAENKAVSKRLEFMLDDRLRNGYETIEGYQIEPNQDYLNMLKEQSWENYYDEAPIEEAPNDIRYSAEDELDLTPFEPQERDVMEMVDNEGYRKSTTQNRPPIPYKQKSGLRQTVDAIKSGFINRNVEIDNLSRDSGNRNIKFYGDMMNSAMGEVSYDIGTAQTNNKGETVGKSIKALFEKAKRKGLGAAFNDFLINYSNIDRYAQNKGSQTPLDVSKRLVRDYAIKYPEFKQWAKDVWNYGKNARQNLVDSGLIDQQLADYLGKIYPHYVPYVSDYENADRYFEGVGELIPKGLKRAKGNAGKLLSVEDALTKYTYAQKMAIRQNDLYKEIVHTLGQTPNFGVDERTDYTDMRNSLYTDSRGNYLTAYENGKQITTQVSKDLFKELSRTTENQLKDVEKKLSLVTKPLQGFSKWRKSLITTWNPTFPVTNAIKDLQDALFNSKHTKDMVKNYPGAIKELATGKGKEVNQFLALYGSGLTMGEYSSDGLNKLSEKIPLVNKIKQINEIVELAPRYAEFKASLQNGETLQEAIYNAREVTTNFNRGGNIAKAMNRNGFTFLNASIQGFDKFIRNFSGENGARGIVQSLAKVAALGILPALFNHLAYDDDEEYEELKDYIKDNYYLIKTGEGKFIRIPKGRMLSVFGSAARRALETASGEEDAFEGYLGNAWNQIGINDPGENNIFAPFIQAFGSENGTAWYGGDIVPSRLQDKPKGEQYDETTDKFSIWLGGKLGVSPKKINYALDQYLGGIGDVLLPMGTEAATSEADSVGDYILAPWADKFTANTTDDSKYVSDFYSKKDEITAKANGEKATDEDILKKKYMDYVSSEMTELYKQKREVQSNPDLTKKEKYNQASDVKKQINGLAKDGLNDYTKVEINGNYAEVNGIKYKKGTDGKWTKQRK